MQRLLEQNPEFNEWKIAFLTPLPVWIAVIIIIALILALISAHLGLSGEKKAGRRILLTALRTTAVISVAFLLLEPAIQLLQVHRIKNRVAVMLDTSGSMSLPTGETGNTRLKTAQNLLEKDSNWFSRNSERFVFEFASFNGGTYPSELDRLLEIENADGEITDIMGAIRFAAGGACSGGRRLAGIMLFSDGVDTEALATGMSPDIRREIEEMEVPVHVFASGDEDDIKDIAITRVLADDFAFVRSAMEIDVLIRSRGYPAMNTPVILRREGRVVASQTVHLEPGEETRTSFRFSPDTTGKFLYTVEVPVLQDEMVTTNNRRSFVLKVIRDRTRVLQVAGRPSWDQRFLRGLLKRDPNVDLISFFILRTPENTRHGPQPHNDELSLIPFPTHELFTQELPTFDLVIFQNFDYMPYQMSQYLRNIRTYVEEGGSFVMIGGEKSFSEGRYQGTYIEDILPVQLVPARSGTVDNEPYAPRITEQGRRHPVTQIIPDTENLERAFSRLPDLPSFNRVSGLHPDAQVLIEHPFLRTQNTNAPVLAVREAGRGRSMAIMTDGTWFWSFPAAGTEGDRRIYDRFWSNAIRWLIRDPELTHVRVRPAKDVFESGETPSVEIEVRNRDYGPAPQARISLEVFRGDTGDMLGRYSGLTNDEGTALIELDPSEGGGPFKVTAEAFEADREISLGREDAAFVVSETGPQMVDPSPRFEILRAIANASGGSFHNLPRNSFPGLRFVDPDVIEIGRKQNHEIWDFWGWLFLLIAAIGTEWALRKRWGHL